MHTMFNLTIVTHAAGAEDRCLHVSVPRWSPEKCTQCVKLRLYHCSWSSERTKAADLGLLSVALHRWLGDFDRPA